MKRLFRFLIIIAVLFVIMFYLNIKFFSAKEGEQAPDFAATLVDKTAFRFSDLKGKYVLLDFWGSWCAPCRRENPMLVELHKKYSDKLIIVTVALEKDSLSWKKASKKDGFVWKHQIVHQNKFVLLSPIARAYGVTEIPAKFLINPKGKLKGRVSFSEVEQVLSQELEAN